MCAPVPESPPAEKSPKSDGARESGKGSEYSTEFIAFWTRYPRKLDKAKAYRCWLKELKAGAKAEDMIAAAKHYAMACRGLRTEERYIKHAATFLGPDRPWLEYRLPPNMTGKVPNARDTNDPLNVYDRAAQRTPSEIKAEFFGGYSGFGSRASPNDVIDVQATATPEDQKTQEVNTHG